MCKVVSIPHESRKFDSQTIEASNSPNCRTNKTPQNETDKVGAPENNTNMPNYFRSNTNKAADKGTSKVLTNKIHNELSNVFSGIGCFEGTFGLQVKDGSHCMSHPLEGWHVH